MIARIAAGTLLVAAFVALGSPGPANAQGGRNNDRDDRVGRIVDDLQNIIREGERRRNPDQDMLNDLRRLVRRYDSPYRVTVLEDDFRDGDMRRDPAWNVLGGEWFVDRSYGMRTLQRPQRRDQNRDRGGNLGNQFLGALLDEAVRGRQGGGGAPDRAEAYVRADISPAFQVTIELNSRSREGGRVEFVLYQGNDYRDGYRLAYTPDAQPNMELIRVRGRDGNVIESSRQRVDMEDGNNHRIVWTRDRDGGMEVEVDGRGVLRDNDRGINGPFDGFGIVNYGGDYGFRSIAINGAERDRR